jgi:hypothetical protein
MILNTISTMDIVAPATDEDDGGADWAAVLAREWADELGDTRQDIYSPDDGGPIGPA